MFSGWRLNGPGTQRSARPGGGGRRAERRARRADRESRVRDDRSHRGVHLDRPVELGVPGAFPGPPRVHVRPVHRRTVVAVPGSRPGPGPHDKAYKYAKAADEITETALPQKATKDRYAGAVNQVALRSLHEVFEADRRGLIQSIALQVGTETIDPATGVETYVPFVAVGADRATFTGFDLAAVVPAATLAHLGRRCRRTRSASSPRTCRGFAGRERRPVFNPPPGWPAPPPGWKPPAGWTPDPSWPDPPPGWELWLPGRPVAAPAASIRPSRHRDADPSLRSSREHRTSRRSCVLARRP